MKKRLLLAFCTFFILLVLVLIINASSAENKVSSNLVKKAELGKVSVIVKLKENVAASTASSLIKNGRKIPSFNGYMTELNAAEIKKLEKDSRIEKIAGNEKNSLFLQQSAPLINATVSWPITVNGINITGRNETACIIDTGINRSHSEFAGKILAEYCYCSNNSERATGHCCPSGIAEEANASDWHGHGTHVAGIITANKSIKGVAPDSKIVMIRVFGEEDGYAYDNDILSAMEWCINNASLYNISVISMSLGGSRYTNYCDSDRTDYADVINEAIANNISVVIASGNNANTTAIASPACIQNATSVGDVYDANVGLITWTGTCTDASTYADKIVCHSNRNALLDLFAPGALINSSWITGGYAELGGTSMATPEVAGAFMLLNQYYKLNFNKSLSPIDIQNTFNSTGKRINDSVTGLNFSRIDVYAAILSLEVAPSIAFASPLNRTYSISQITINITSDSTNQSIWWYNETANLTYSDVTYLNLTNGTHTFIAYANNSFGNINTTSVTFRLDAEKIDLFLITPTNTSLIQNASRSQFFNITVNVSCPRSDCGEINISLSNSTSLISTNTSYNLYTNESNPRNISLNQSESQLVIFYLNSTSSFGSNDSFFIYANQTANQSISNITSVWNITVVCGEDWSCSDWSTCSDSSQTRTCTDNNNCGTEHEKPDESQSCNSGGGGGDDSGAYIPLTIINQTINLTANQTNNQTNLNNNLGDSNKINSTNKTINKSANTSNSINKSSLESAEKNSKKYIYYILGVVAILAVFLIVKIARINNHTENEDAKKKGKKPKAKYERE